MMLIAHTVKLIRRKGYQINISYEFIMAFISINISIRYSIDLIRYVSSNPCSILHCLVVLLGQVE